jgi:hypothetical protein
MENAVSLVFYLKKTEKKRKPLGLYDNKSPNALRTFINLMLYVCIVDAVVG